MKAPSVNNPVIQEAIKRKQQQDAEQYAKAVKADADKVAAANATNAQTRANAKTDTQKEQAALAIAGNDNTDMGKVLLAGAQGQDVGSQFFGEGSLGRMSEGFSSAESQAMRGQADRQISMADKQANRRIKIGQAQSGMSGGAAAFQQAQLVNERVQQTATVNRDLFLAQEQQRRQDIQFNLQQAAKEKAGRLSTTLGFMQMQQGLLTADKQANAILNAPTAAQGGGLLDGIFPMMNSTIGKLASPGMAAVNMISSALPKI